MLTSSKSTIAHGEGGAGLAGFIKACLQVMHCEAASNAHFRVLNPHLDLVGFPTHIVSENLSFSANTACNGVSSFGFGGTNAHGEAWGKNIMTSRGSRPTDPGVVLNKYFANAPPPEIIMNGDDVEDWETTGADPGAPANTNYQVVIDGDGTTQWEKEEIDPAESAGDFFFIQGTHNDWAPEAMDVHGTIPDLWTGVMVLGPSGQEEFQIIADEDPAMIYAPGTQHCTLKASKVVGPGDAPRENAWMVRGRPGDAFRIEAFVPGKVKSVLWLKQ